MVHTAYSRFPLTPPISDRCNYMEVYLPGQDVSDSRFTTQAFAVDVCRTYVSPNGTEYRKYICKELPPSADDDYDFLDEVYDTSDCSGDPLYTDILDDDPDFSGGHCGQLGRCNYTMMKTPCEGDPDTYAILPVFFDTCISPGTISSYLWTCDPFKKSAYKNSRGCYEESGTPFDFFDRDLVNGTCLTASDFTEGGPSYEPMSNGCQSIDYTPSPTSNPTMEPTETTGTPTGTPTDTTNSPTTPAPTDNPTLEPTAAPEPDNASFINIIGNYIFVIFLVLFINFV